MFILSALLTGGSSGALRRPRWPNSALSFRSIGTPTLPMRQTSLSCGWELAPRACSNKLIIIRPSPCLLSPSSRFVGDYTVVPRRKYYSMGLFTVSHSSPRHSTQHLTRETADADACRNTPSRMDTCTSPTPTMSLQLQILFPAISSRQSLVILSGPYSNLFFFIYQSSGRAPSDVGIQGPA